MRILTYQQRGNTRRVRKPEKFHGFVPDPAISAYRALIDRGFSPESASTIAFGGRP